LSWEGQSLGITRLDCRLLEGVHTRNGKYSVTATISLGDGARMASTPALPSIQSVRDLTVPSRFVNRILGGKGLWSVSDKLRQ
jgi:hypothetical protein